jgi:hypothetical protein
VTPYLVTATDRAGRRDTFAREAASLEHLRMQLEAQGYTDIEFVDDELSARLRAQRPEDGRPRTQADFRLEAKFRHGTTPGQLWLLAIRKAWLPFALMGGAAAYGVRADKPAWTVGAIAFLVFWLWMMQRGLARAERYNDLLRAYARGDWAHSRKLIDALRGDASLAGNEQLQADLQFRSAALRAIGGDLAGALADVEPLRTSAQGAGGMFASRVASIHYLSGDVDGFLRNMEQGWEASGRAQLQQLDLAFANARVGDPARARELLAGVERRNLSALHQPIATATEGLIAQREGQDAQAVDKLTDGVTGLGAFGANPAVWPILGILLGHQGLALARTGQREAARAVLEGWRDIVDTCLDPATRSRLQNELSA